MPRKCSFQDCWLKDSAYQEWVLKDELDKHYARCVACKIQHFVFLTVVMVFTKSNIGPYKSLFGFSPSLWEPCFYSVFWIFTKWCTGVCTLVTALFGWYVAHATRSCCHLGAYIWCTPFIHAQVYSVSSFKQHSRVPVCSAVTWHLYYWHNDPDLLLLLG